MAEFASKGVAGTGLGLGIAGTALGILNNNGNGGGLLGNLLGGGANYREMEEMRAENTILKAQKYTDDVARVQGVEISNLKTENAVQAEQIAAMKREAELREKLTDCKIEKVALTAANGIDKVACGLDCLERTVRGITSTYVPAASVTPLPAPWPFPPVPPYGPAPWPPFPFFPPVPPVAPPTTTTTTTTPTTTTTTTGA